MDELDAPELKERLLKLCKENIEVLQDLAQRKGQKTIEALGVWATIQAFLLEGMKPSEFPKELQEELKFAYDLEVSMNPFKN
jgi:hypothetical protein